MDGTIESLHFFTDFTHGQGTLQHYSSRTTYDQHAAPFAIVGIAAEQVHLPDNRWNLVKSCVELHNRWGRLQLRKASLTQRTTVVGSYFHHTIVPCALHCLAGVDRPALSSRTGDHPILQLPQCMTRNPEDVAACPIRLTTII